MLRSLSLLSLILFVIASGPFSFASLPSIVTALAATPSVTPTNILQLTPLPTRTPTRTTIPTRVTSTPTPTPISPTPTYYFVRFTATPTRDTRTPRPTQPLARATVDLSPLLPDLRMLPPADFMIETTPDGTRLLRLTNYIMNWGPGRLEVMGVSDAVTQRTVVTQHIYRGNGLYEKRPAGIFIFHPAHNHWHLENFARYEVWSLTPGGEPDTQVALSAKVSYCLRDTGRSTLASAPQNPRYTECLDKTQGISTGWIDSYEFDIPDQTVDVSSLADGVYLVRCVVDPGDLFLEANENNNVSLSFIQISGDSVQELTHEQAIAELDASQ